MVDGYTLRARVFPMILLFFPAIILGLLYAISLDSLIPLAASTVVVGALTYLFAHLGRTYGKKKEPALWKYWGGKPSIQLLRWHNPVVDVHTKQRYHTKLQQLAPVPYPPDAVQEAADPKTADAVYESWNSYLLASTRDRTRFSLLLKENAGYGFRRNLWGTKRFALILLLLLAVANYFYNVHLSRSWAIQNMSANFYTGMLTVLAFVLFWIFVVTKTWVRSAADAYAIRLLETITQL